MIKLCVVGGGYTGVISAILAAKIRDEAGNTVYDITLIDREPEILSGASLTPTRLHLGGEYPKDQQTALECLHGAMIFDAMMPKDIYTGQTGVKYLVTKDSASGQLPEQDSLSMEQTVASYEAIRSQYQKFCEQTKSQPFGKPEELFTALTSDQYAEFQDIVGGIKANERSVNPIRYGTFLEESLKKQKNIRVLTETEVQSLKKISNGKWIVQTNAGAIEADLIVNATFENELALRTSSQETSTDDSAKVFLRGMAVLDISKYPAAKEAVFVMIGRDGFMMSPFNENYALLFKTGDDVAYIDGITLTTQNSAIPQEWLQKMARGTPDEVQRKETAINKVAQFLPPIREAKPIAFKVRPTVSYDEHLSERRDKGLILDDEGSLIGVVATKMTYCPFKGCQVMNHLVKQAEAKGFKTNLSEEQKIQLQDVAEGRSVALPNFCSIAHEVEMDLSFFKKAGLYAMQRNLPTAMVAAFRDSMKVREAITIHPITFVAIHGENVSPLDIFHDPKYGGLGTHIHAICDELVQKNDKKIKTLDLPNTVVAHGTILSISTNQYVTGINEEDRRKKIGGQYGIASHHDKKGQINDETIIVDGAAYFIEHSGRTKRYREDDGFSFLEVFDDPKNKPGAVEISEKTTIRDIPHLVELSQEALGKRDSFCAVIKADCDTSMLKLNKGGQYEVRVISGYDQTGKPFKNLKEMWKNWRQGETVGGHVETFKDLKVNKIELCPVDQFLIAHPKGEFELGGYRYRLADSKVEVEEAAKKIQKSWKKSMSERAKQKAEIVR